MEQVDCIVVGAGVIGLAIARRLAQVGREVVVVEAATAIGTETSSRNSEVIHAGIYYPAESLKARHCVRGRRALYDYCRDHNIPHRRCGKLIVAVNPEEEDELAAIKVRAEANGVTDLAWLDAAQAGALEPALRCSSALLSPSTGILDSHAFMLSLWGEAEDAGAAFAFNAPFLRAGISNRQLIVDIGGATPMTLRCALLVNAAGLQAPAVARAIDGMPPTEIPTAYFAKGNYFSCTRRVPFTHLIYPVPEKGGLGVHLTIDLNGQAKFGPDVEWANGIDYSVDPDRAAVFYPAIRRYWPDLPNGALAPAFAGVRPKIVPPAIASQDFIIQGPRDHAVPGLINLFGIESPGLTSSLSIADHVTDLARQ